MSDLLTMFDAVNVGAIPSNAKAVAGYVDGHWPTFGALAGRFYGHAHCLSITVAGADAACVDCESGDVRPEHVLPWIEQQLARGRWRPVVYANQATWDSLVPGTSKTLYQQLEPYGRRIRRWVAAYPGGGAVVPGGYDAHQYTNHADGRSLDASVCLPSFFPGAAPAPKPKPTKRKPHPKATAAGIAGAATAAIVAYLTKHGVHVHLTKAEVGLIATAASAIAAQVKKA